MKFSEKLKIKAKKLKGEMNALALAFSDKRTPIAAKVMIALTLMYFLSPIDLIPDFIPVLGYLDDLIILPLMIVLAIKLIPDNVMNECRIKSQGGVKMNSTLGWVAAAVIIILWTVIIVYIIKLIVVPTEETAIATDLYLTGII